MKKFEHKHDKITGFSGNEIFCLKKLDCIPGQLCIGNNVIALGVVRSVGAGLSTLAGGEVEAVTNLIHDGRKHAFERMMKEVEEQNGIGLAGVSFDIINHGGNLEFLCVGSVIHDISGNSDNVFFSTSDSAQELYCQFDAGFVPHRFVFANVAYSIGVGGSIFGSIRSLRRGEVLEYTEIFNTTRHITLAKIILEAKKTGANAVLGIKTSISAILRTQEMMMIGTASNHPALENYNGDPVTSGMTNQELWSLVNMGYLPIKLVIGVSVYSLGFAGGIKSFFRSIAGGKIDTVSNLLYEARQKAFERIQLDASACGADEVVGVKTYIYDLGGGLFEFLAIGTAVKKFENVTTTNESLIVQATTKEQDTFVDSELGKKYDLDSGQKTSSSKLQAGPITIIVIIFMVIYYIAKILFIASF